MKINKKIYLLLVIIFSLATTSMAVLYFLHFVSLDVVMLFGGLSQLFIGLNQINSAQQQIGSKGINKANKGVGIFSIILGLTIIVGVLIKMIL